MDATLLSTYEKDTLIALMMKAEMHSWVYSMFKNDLDLEQKLEILKRTNSSAVRNDIASSENLTQEDALKLNKAGKYSQTIKWKLMQNTNLDLDFRKKLLTRGMINTVIKTTDRIHNYKRRWKYYYSSKSSYIENIEKAMPADIWPYVKERYDDARCVKDIIL